MYYVTTPAVNNNLMVIFKLLCNPFHYLSMTRIVIFAVIGISNLFLKTMSSCNVAKKQIKIDIIKIYMSTHIICIIVFNWTKTILSTILLRNL